MLRALALLLALLPTAAPAAELTVLELFQSQGCSSCPPANANVNALASRPDILALSFAVTYWDGLGWKDVFARQAFTDRQWAYARGLGNAQVWTPQVIINGRSTIVGNRRAPLEALVAGSPRVSSKALNLTATSLAISGMTSKPADVWLVRYDPRSIDVPVKAGENGGRTLPHRNVVRELIKLGRWQGGAVSFPLPAARSPGLATAALLQDGPGGPILAAAKG